MGPILAQKGQKCDRPAMTTPKLAEYAFVSHINIQCYINTCIRGHIPNVNVNCDSTLEKPLSTYPSEVEESKIERMSRPTLTKADGRLVGRVGEGEG